MMDRIKQNPFLSGCIAAALVLIVGGGFFVLAEAVRLSEEETAFDDNKMLLKRLESNKPFPDEANVKQADDEVAETRRLLDELASEFKVDLPLLSPQAFQDELNRLVKDIRQLAKVNRVSLPDDFYLGFETYETQPPASQEIASQLGLQLRSIHAVAKVLTQSRVSALGSITRSPLPVETPAVANEDDSGKKKQKRDTRDDKSGPAFSLAPFNVNFTANQSSFRLAFNDILDLTPPIFVRLLTIDNSAGTAPSKTEQADAVAKPDQSSGPDAIKAVLGREKLIVNLLLSSINSAPSTP